MHNERVVTSALPMCPAADGVAETPRGSGCVCRIEDHLIESTTEGSTLALYCFGDYKACSTWRADKENHWALRSNKSLLRSGEFRVKDEITREKEHAERVLAESQA